MNRTMLLCVVVATVFALSACNRTEQSDASESTQEASTANSGRDVIKQDAEKVANAQVAAERAKTLAAEEGVAGVLMATIDGKERVWRLYNNNKPMNSEWETLADSPGVNVTLYGRPAWSDEGERRAPIEVGFKIHGESKAGRDLAVDYGLITFYAPAMTKHFTSGRGNADIAVARQNLMDDVLEISGSFKGRLNYKNWREKTSGEEDYPPIEISDGAFYAVLQK